jgi:sec-independent protein translocase protein TatA
MFGLGMTEIVIIIVVLGIIFFGSSKITNLAKSAGRFSGEYKKGKAEMEGELNKIKENFKTEEEKVVVKSEVAPLVKTETTEEKEEEKSEPPIFSKFG